MHVQISCVVVSACGGGTGLTPWPGPAQAMDRHWATDRGLGTSALEQACTTAVFSVLFSESSTYVYILYISLYIAY